jgi:hypothetical protein
MILKVLQLFFFLIVLLLDTLFPLPMWFICWFSKKFYDIHDYHKRLGGDDIPTHFHEYTCWNCGKKFYI